MWPDISYLVVLCLDTVPSPVNPRMLGRTKQIYRDKLFPTVALATAQSPNRTGLFVSVLTGRLTSTVDFPGLSPGPVRLHPSLIRAPFVPHSSLQSL